MVSMATLIFFHLIHNINFEEIIYLLFKIVFLFLKKTLNFLIGILVL